MKKKKRGRPKRFKGDYSTVQVQLSKEHRNKFEAFAKDMKMSNSKFGEFLLDRFLESQGKV